MFLVDRVSKQAEGPKWAQHEPWYLPYPPCTFSCTPFCTSLSRILVLAGLSNPAAFKIWVALIQSSALLRITLSLAILNSYTGT